MNISYDEFCKPVINTTGHPVRWRMFFYDDQCRKVLECCEDAITADEATEKVLNAIAGTKLAKSISAVDRIIQ